MSTAPSTLARVRDWHGIRALRQQIEQELHALPTELRRDLAMVAAELAENGLRHGDAGEAGDGVRVALERAASFVELCVTTPLKASERARAVLQRVREIDATLDKESAYVERLLALARGADNTTSELGFHRIATEGRCSLRAAHEGEELTICARRAL